MAFVGLVPQTLNVAIRQGLDQEFQSNPVLNLAGTAVNLSAWTSLTATLCPPSPVPYGTNANFGTVTGGSTGVISLQTAATDLASVPPGSGTLIIKGKPTSGDEYQVLATGTLTIQAGS